MAKSDDIKNELTDFGSELPIGNNNPLTVPSGYFDGLAASIMSKIKANQISFSEEIKELSPFLAGISKEIPYSVPENYFEENMESLPAMYSEVESPILSQIGKGLPYEVPANYFESVSERLTSILPKEEAKVIPMFSRKWVRMAAVAAITGLLVFAGIGYLNNSDQENGTVIVQKEKEPDSNKTNSIAKHNASINNKSIVKELSSLSTEELDSFIKNVELNPAKSQTASVSSSAGKKVKDILKDVPNEELDSFLDQIPTGDDELFIID